jgi:hypothetical protein
LSQFKERAMRSFLINKNLSLYYWLRKRIGKRQAQCIANTIEKTILLFGREVMPSFNKNGMLTEQPKLALRKMEEQE